MLKQVQHDGVVVASPRGRIDSEAVFLFRSVVIPGYPYVVW